MVFVTGDTHGILDFAKMKNFAEHKNFTKDDYVIIAGDCGIVWSEKNLLPMANTFMQLPFTTLFVDGNHENFDLLNKYPVKKWSGGRVHRIAPSIYHLMRGQVYKIDGKTIFTFGGAESTDKVFRSEGISWWKQETPTVEEYKIAHDNLSKEKFKVDYIITHAADQSALNLPMMKMHNYPCSTTNVNLSQFEERVNYKHWYFGHYHIDIQVSPKKTAVFTNFIELL